MNKVILIGRLAADPELKYTQGGKAVASFTLAVDRPYKREGGPDADFFRCTCWAGQAEALCRYMKKGGQLAVEGEGRIDAYTDKEGVKRYPFTVNAARVSFLGNKRSGGGESSGAIGEEVDFDEGDLPFGDAASQGVLPY